MRKFQSSHDRLEVTHTSRPQSVYLNHQVIMLLSNLGVPDDAFIALQKEMLDKLAGKLFKKCLFKNLQPSIYSMGNFLYTQFDML